MLIHDLTQRYGPVIREAKVVGVLDAAFDVLVPEFGIEKRVHVEQMPIDVSYSSTSLFHEQAPHPSYPPEPHLRRTQSHPPDLLVGQGRHNLARREQ